MSNSINKVKVIDKSGASRGEFPLGIGPLRADMNGNVYYGATNQKFLERKGDEYILYMMDGTPIAAGSFTLVTLKSWAENEVL